MSGGAANVGLLTNAEVADLLASQIRGNKPRGGHAKNTGAMDRKLPQVDFIERSVSKYLAATTVKGVDLTAIADIRRQLLAMSLGLMEAELLQLLNHFPQHAVEVHLIIEECAERLSEEQVDKILEIFHSKLPSAN